jgi:hypothetical protein
MIPIRVTSSPTLKTQERSSDKRRNLQLTLRVYRNGLLIDRFNYYLKDLGQPIYLLPSELRKGMVVDHSRGIRYTNLIQFTRKTFEEVIKKELTTKTVLNRELVKDLVTNAIDTDFELEFASDLNQQLITIEGSGYNKFTHLTIDKRALDAFANSTIPTEPSVDPLGQVDLNDFDIGDFELMILDAHDQLQKEAKEIRIGKLATELRYKKGLYNKTNIFELFASIYFDEKKSDTYNKIVIRLFEYRHFTKPKEETSYFDETWIANFFTFLWNEGYTNLSTKNFDPLKFNPDIFSNKEKKKYDVDNYYKLLEITQTVSNKFNEDGLLTKLDFSKIDLFKICGLKKNKKGKRVKNNIKYSEFNELFFFRFEQKNLESYQAIFSQKYDKSTIQIEITDLETVRDLFCLQTMSGGLRGFRELQTLRFSKNDKHISFYMKKIDYWMINPFNVYTEIIASTRNYELPKLQFGNSANTLEHIYRALLKTIAEIIPFDRHIIYKQKTTSIKDIFNPYFARKTFSQIMYDEYNFTLENISMFTGHSFERDKKSVLLNNYIDTESPEKKKKLFDLIKLPKGYTRKTLRTEP